MNAATRRAINLAAKRGKIAGMEYAEVDPDAGRATVRGWP